jgi:hypothetical protein
MAMRLGQRGPPATLYDKTGTGITICSALNEEKLYWIRKIYGGKVLTVELLH